MDLSIQIACYQLQPDDIVSGIDVDDFAGYTAGGVAQQIQAGRANLFKLDVSVQTCFAGCMAEHLVELG